MIKKEIESGEIIRILKYLGDEKTVMKFFKETPGFADNLAQKIRTKIINDPSITQEFKEKI